MKSISFFCKLKLIQKCIFIYKKKVIFFSLVLPHSAALRSTKEMPQWLKSTLIFFYYFWFFELWNSGQKHSSILLLASFLKKDYLTPIYFSCPNYSLIIIIISTINNVFSCSSILNSNGEKPLTAYLIHSIPLQQSAVQIFAGDKMSVVAHLVGMEQLGYEKSLGMTLGVSTTWFSKLYMEKWVSYLSYFFISFGKITLCSFIFGLL